MSNPPTMRSNLEKKVEGMRSQKMTFANDGVELSLSVPDSADVKATFGTMVDTVVDQNEELGRLNVHLDKVVHDNTTSRNKLVAATTQRLQQLMKHQLRMENQLKSAQDEIKNFAYNIQGYVDDNDDVPPEPASMRARMIQDIGIDLKDVAAPDDDVSIRSGHTTTLYPTEAGAPISSQITFQSTSGSVRKKPKSKSSLLYYQSIRKKALPHDARARWKWAYKKVMQMIRLKSMKIGLSRTRVNKSQTLIQRIDKMDDELFAMPGIVEAKLKSSMESLLGEVGTQIEGLQNQIVGLEAKAAEREAALSAQVAQLESTVQVLDKRITGSIVAMEDKQLKMESMLMTNMSELRNQLKDAVALDLDRLRLGLQDINEELFNLDKTANSALTDLKALVMDDADIQKLEVVAALDQLVENNAAIQQFRSTVAVSEASSDILQRTINSLKRDVGAAQHHYSQKFLGAHAIVSRDEASRLEEILMRSRSSDGHMKVVRDTLSVMKGLLKKHDANLTNLSQQVNSQTTEATKAFPSMKAGLEELQINANGMQDTLRDSVEDIQQIHVSVDKLEKSNAVLMQRHEEDTKTDSLTPDVYKELATLKIQMDAIRTLLFDKSRPGSSNVAEAAAKAAMMAAGSAVVAPNPHPTEGFADLIPADLRNQMQMQYSDDIPFSHTGTATPGAFGGGGGGGGISRGEMQATVVTLLKQLLPDLMQDVPMPTMQMFQPEASMADAAPPGQTHQQEQQQHQEEEEVVEISPSELARQRIAARGQRPKVEQHSSDPHQPQMAARGSSPPAGGGGGDIASAIRQVQQVFGGDQSQQVQQVVNGVPVGPTGSPGKSTPMAVVNPGVRVAIKSKQSMDLSSRSEHNTPSRQPRRLGGLRGSFEAFGGSPSRVGSFMVADFPSPSFDPSPMVNDIAALRAELINTRRKIELMDEEKVTKQLVERLCSEAMAEQRRRDARTDYRSMIEDADKSIRDLVNEIIYLKRNQESSAQMMRDELNRALENTVQTALVTVTDSLKESVVSTKGLCLSCGRASTVRTEAQRPSSPQPFFPQLSTNSLPGPDVLRGGFKMPVRSSSPPPPSLAPLTSSANDRDIPLLLRGKVGFDPKSGRHNYTSSELNPEVNALHSSMDSDYDGPDGQLLHDPAEHGRPYSSEGHGPSRSADTNGLRPIFRKGFPARKSTRAEMNFAPERFDLQSLTLQPGRAKQQLSLPLASQSLTSFAPPPLNS